MDITLEVKMDDKFKERLKIIWKPLLTAVDFIREYGVEY